MSQQLINHSSDLKKLRDEGYEIEVKGGYLIIHHIPYLNSRKEIKYGKLISTLTLNNNVTMKPDNHVIHFMGEYPCNNDGTIITAIQHANPNRPLFDSIVMNFSFSNKPSQGYTDYFEKVTRYIEIISSPAKSIDSKVNAKSFKVITDNIEETLFNYIDTNASRANIYNINSKFKGQKIGIIGLGGTGSYVLDLVAKTPVDEIHLFDGDLFLQHNAFRSPGAPSIQTLNEQLNKVDYFSSIYSNMHKGIKVFPFYITEENIRLLKGLTYVFICIDSNSARGKIMSSLKQLGITFIDVGLGINIGDENLVGTARVTVGTAFKTDHIPNRIGTEDIDNNEYSTNIQIADMNALNALMAVIKWKKMSGFYQDLKEEHHSTYTINTAQLINNDFTA
jgi:predicted ThiF/HesA family dinucleotide-utilizing enzyme